VRLTRREARDGRLPRVCLVCGARASGCKSKVMSWHPPWVYILLLAGVLPFPIVALVMQKRMRVEAPLCRRHQNHWLVRTLTIVLSLVGGIVIGCGLLMFASQRAGRADNTGLICIGIALLGGLWLLLVAILSLTAVRPQEITDDSITLTGVSDEFIDAMEEFDEDEIDDEDDDDRPRRRRRPPSPRYEGDDAEEERPRRPRRPPPPAGEPRADEDRPRRRPPPDAYEERDE